MTQNPAIALYNAWNGLFQLRMHSRHRNYYNQTLPSVNTDDPEWLDQVPDSTRNSYGLNQMLDWNTIIKPTATLPDGRPFYALGYQHQGRFDSLFQLAPNGAFRLGKVFDGWPTRGAYERVDTHTFLSANRAYDHNHQGWIWWVQGYDEPHQHWCQTRDWRTHTYYWRHRTMLPASWFTLRRSGGVWRATIAPQQTKVETLKCQLHSQYKAVEDHYAKWRRRYHRKHGLPDPEKALDSSDIETVDHLTQHLRVYDPPKAQMPA